MRPYGRIFFPWFLLGILQPHLNCGRGVRPLSFVANETRAKGRTVTGRLEKLAQEGLRGDRNRLAVGKRVGSGVREVAHDLKGVSGAGRLLHRRERMVAEAEVFHCGRFIKIDFRHQYQTDRLVRMVNTKLTDGSEWHGFLKYGRGLCPLSFAANGTRAKR